MLYALRGATTVPPAGTKAIAAAMAAIPEPKTRASPCSRAPTASSSAVQVALPLRPYPVPARGAAYVADSSIGGLTGAPGTRGGRPAATTRLAGARSSRWPAARSGSWVPVTGATLPAG